LLKSPRPHNSQPAARFENFNKDRDIAPFIGGVALGFGIGIVRLERVVDDDDVAATTGQCAPDRCRQPEAARREFDLGL